MQPILRILFLGFSLLCVAAPTDKPVVDVDYQRNLKLWRAQKSILAAYEYVEQAEQDSRRGLGEHSSKARALLQQAAREIKIASLAGKP
ncbi:hypothetical protein [Paludibaculum fermentans]|uniref:Uncharacterized protein n=1 Tax=Paludibaculum fermentans TaxID=1473598 RepID=A0A7S7NWA1_PALFE|nr:hypothetical protein [Paludibaculum fermentans]QOY90359.1 hypothetical protein IRI77_10505 [Paludibaculum fermentans]